MLDSNDPRYRRELMLEEMGFQPRWVRRSLLPAANTVSAATSQPVVTLVAAREAAPVRRPPLITPAPVAQLSARAEPASDERSIAISQMDWPELAAAVKNCTACGLCQSRTQTVFSAGLPEAELMVIGEAPGADEDRQGEPFVGQAGKLLDSMLGSIARSRSNNVYIANVLKCRPPQNRNPQPEEMALCAPFLHRQIALVAPKVLFAVGRFAIQTLLQREEPIKSLRGKLHDYNGTPVVISYHPAYLLRNLPDKAKAWEDLLLVKHHLPPSH